MTDKIMVLNGGFVRLVSYMQPASGYVPGDYLWSGDLEVVRNARVSYDADWREGDEEKDAKLIEYLYKNKHTSPFEAMVFTFEVKAPIFVLRQWHRHRTWSYNEVSARYAELDEGFYVPKPSVITTQSPTNKQMRTHTEHPKAAEMAAEIDQATQAAFQTYRRLIREGCPRELARSVLPVAAYSRMFATVDAHNLFHFLRLRLHPHAQYEIRVYAEALLKLVEPVMPVSVQAFRKSQETQS